jgi:hypothetical protein
LSVTHGKNPIARINIGLNYATRYFYKIGPRARQSTKLNELTLLHQLVRLKGATTFSIMAFRRTTFDIIELFATLSMCVSLFLILSFAVLGTKFLLFSECRYAECRYAGCRYVKGLSTK